MKLTRILSLALALLMLAGAFVACGPKEDPEVDAGAPEADVATTLELVTKGTANYVIVYNYKAEGTVKSGVDTMVEAFKTYLNCDITFNECYDDREVEEDVVLAKEILVGDTNRPETEQVKNAWNNNSGMKANDYDIEIVGEKLVIVGGSDAATAKAIATFLGGFVYEQGDKNEVRKNGKKFPLYAYKNILPESDPTDTTLAEKNKFDVDEIEFSSTGIYSYNYATMGGARLDSYVLVSPSESNYKEVYDNFSIELQAYISKEVGFNLDHKRDKAVMRADYMITVGDTAFTDEAIVDAMQDDEYYIALDTVEIEFSDGTIQDVTVLTILFGTDAYDAAMAAYKRIMPHSASPIDFNMSVGFVETNMANLPA